MIHWAAFVPPFLLGDSHGYVGVGMARLLGFCIAFLFASSVAASTIDVGPSDWRKYGPSATHTTGGVQSTFGQNVRLPPTISGPTRVLPVSRNPVIPYGSIANGAKNFVRVSPQSIAASAAITALFMGLDWVFDEDLDSWMKDTVIKHEDPALGLFSSTLLPSSELFPTAEAACVAGVGSNPLNLMFDGVVPQSGGSTYQCWFINPNNNNRQQYGGSTQQTECPAGYQLDTTIGACVYSDVIELSPEDWEVLEQSLPSRPANQVAEAASDIQRRQGGPLPGYQDMSMTGPSSITGPSTTSTSTNPVTGDITVTETSSQTGLDYGETTITTTTTTTSTTYENGQETSTTVETETPGELPVSSGGGAVGDWPGFCEWASVVCDWINWTREEPPPEQDLPSVIDDDFYQDKNISFGAKSCPPPYEINLAPFLESTVGVSFQPLCDFAGLIYYMVMAASYIIAAYISIGVARNA